jgi:hypothetical protein
MLKEISQKGIIMLTYLFNAIIRLQYWPKQLKIAEIILIPKPGKNPNLVSSYRSISLLSTISKLLEKLTSKNWSSPRCNPTTSIWLPPFPLNAPTMS